MPRSTNAQASPSRHLVHAGDETCRRKEQRRKASQNTLNAPDPVSERAIVLELEARIANARAPKAEHPNHRDFNKNPNSFPKDTPAHILEATWNKERNLPPESEHRIDFTKTPNRFSKENAVDKVEAVVRNARPSSPVPENRLDYAETPNRFAKDTPAAVLEAHVAKARQAPQQGVPRNPNLIPNDATTDELERVRKGTLRFSPEQVAARNATAGQQLARVDALPAGTVPSVSTKRPAKAIRASRKASAPAHKSKDEGGTTRTQAAPSKAKEKRSSLHAVPAPDAQHSPSRVKLETRPAPVIKPRSTKLHAVRASVPLTDSTALPRKAVRAHPERSMQAAETKTHTVRMPRAPDVKKTKVAPPGILRNPHAHPVMVSPLLTPQSQVEKLPRAASLWHRPTLMQLTIAGTGIASILAIRVAAPDHKLPTQPVATPVHYTMNTGRQMAGDAPLQHPMTGAERHAKIFLDRMLADDQMVLLINDLRAVTGLPAPRIMNVFAAETGGMRGNPMQVKPDQFERLITLFGKTYASELGRYAATLGGARADHIGRLAADLQLVSSYFSQDSATGKIFRNDDLFNRDMRERHGKHAHFMPLQKIIDRLYGDDIITSSLQLASNMQDDKVLARKFAPAALRDVLGTDPLRAENFLGLPALEAYVAMRRAPETPVIGHLMSTTTAIANGIKDHYEITQRSINDHGHLRLVMKRELKPYTIGTFENVFMKPWAESADAFDNLLKRPEYQQRLNPPKLDHSQS